ncbi:MAG: oligoendopeptidase F [Pirellulales bacterium]
MIASTKKKSKKKSAAQRIPTRGEVKATDTWDLASLFADDAAWEQAFKAWEKKIDGYAKFPGTLDKGAAELAAFLKFDLKMEREGERLGVYAFLRTTEDQANSKYQRMAARLQNAASRAGQAASFFQPELMAIPTAKMNRIVGDRKLAPYRLLLERLLRYKPHTLSDKEERLLAMQSEMSSAASQVFRQLNDADMRFGAVKDAEGTLVELSHSTLSSLLQSEKRAVRKNAFQQYYAQYTAHENTLAAALNGSVQRDIYYARARGYSSALDAALFPDNVPRSVYDNLIAAVHDHLPALYRYFDIRRRRMKLRDIHHYDTYVPILSDVKVRHTWDQAVRKVVDAAEPLGSEYCQVMERGLSGRWCDRYENQGKQSGAFSAGTFDGDPYILMNYQTDVLNHVFTLAHEAGHSMHSYYSAKTQPFQYYDYTIFVAEVASTFNEQLLGKYLMDRAKTDAERAYLINKEIDDIRATVIRQTMFAEFEMLAHASAEANEPLTLERFKEIYRGLLELYFGPDFVLDDELSLECLRIPHFYRAFYVYKYATGLSAAIALAERVLNGGNKERDDYLNFLKGGCSKYPLDLLRDAGVDMESRQPVDAALARFSQLVDELDELL